VVSEKLGEALRKVVPGAGVEPKSTKYFDFIFRQIQA
jgi:hypothetical protein